MAIRSEKKEAEISLALQARSGRAAVVKYLPRQMTLWPENFRATANEFARSALFRCTDSRKPRAQLKQEDLFILHEGKMTYTGEELRLDDEDVFLTLAHFARDLPSGNMVVEISSSDICKINGWRQSQHYYTNIFHSIQRMTACSINLMSRRLALALKCQRALASGANDDVMSTLYRELADFEKSPEFNLPLSELGGEIAGMMVQLLNTSTFTNVKKVADNVPQGNLHWKIHISAEVSTLFAKPWLTMFDFNQRQLLPPTAKRLQTYFQSHRQPHPVLLRSLEKMLGMNVTDLASLKSKMTNHLDALKDAGVLKDYAFSKSKNGSDWLITVEREPLFKPQTP